MKSGIYLTEIQVQCPSGSKTLMIQAYSAGLSDLVAFTCERDSIVLSLPIQGNLLDKAFGGKRSQGVWSVSDLKKLESVLIPCPCGGSFRHDVIAKCPNWGGPLSTEGNSHSTYFVVGKKIDGEKQNPFRDVVLRKVWTEWRQGRIEGGIRVRKALEHFRQVAIKIEPQLEDALSGKAQFDSSQIAVGSNFDREAIFAWTFYQARSHSLTLRDFLSVYDQINKDVPSASEVIWAFSRLITRTWLIKQGNQYIITNQGVATIQNVVGGGQR